MPRTLIIWAVGGLLGCTSTTGPTPGACSDRSVADCTGTEGCTVLRARRLGDDGAGNPCFDPTVELEAIACGADTSCASAEAVAEDEEGQQWLFPSLCLPDGFTEVGSYAPDCP